MSSKLFIFEQAEKDLKALLRLSREKLRDLADYIQKERSFSLNPEDYWKLSKLIRVSNEEILTYIQILRYLYSQARDFRLDGKETEKALLAYLKKKDMGKKQSADSIPEKVAIIAELVSSDLLRREAKIRQLKQGVIKHAVDFRSFCDYRPLFTSPKRDEIDSLIPIVITRIRVRDDTGKEEELIFQLNEDTARDFLEFAKDIEKKLKTMREYEGQKIKITE